HFRHLSIFDKIIVESSCSYNELSKLNFSQKLLKKLVVIPNGCNTKDNKINKYIRKKIILSVGRISYQKGFDILIKSFEMVHKIHTDWQLRIVGPIADENYYRQLKNLVFSLGLENSVIFTGVINENDLEKEYNESSIFCLLSRYEGFPIVRMETIAHGLPMITSEAGCGIEYAKYGSIVVPIENVEKPAEAMLKLIENPELREEISKKQMNALITWDDVAKRIDDLLNSK
ncbi:MAG: glycosyltransferase family 4 protein, partial [Thermoplasmata archaeon]